MELWMFQSDAGASDQLRCGPGYGGRVDAQFVETWINETKFHQDCHALKCDHGEIHALRDLPVSHLRHFNKTFWSFCASAFSSASLNNTSIPLALSWSTSIQVQRNEHIAVMACSGSTQIFRFASLVTRAWQCAEQRPTGSLRPSCRRRSRPARQPEA